LFHFTLAQVEDPPQSENSSEVQEVSIYLSSFLSPHPPAPSPAMRRVARHGFHSEPRLAPFNKVGHEMPLKDVQQKHRLRFETNHVPKQAGKKLIRSKGEVLD
jgi:hypothetical protein